MTLSRLATTAVAVVSTASVVSLGVSPACAAESAHNGPKNIIYMIGDGMGYGHLALTNLYETGQSKYLVDGAFGDKNLKEKDGVRLPSFSGHPICTDLVSVREDVHCESTAQEVHAGVPA